MYVQYNTDSMGCLCCLLVCRFILLLVVCSQCYILQQYHVIIFIVL